MLILGIETSCDETSCAIIEDNKRILSNVISSQVQFHKKYGGVVPEIASRKHLETINILLNKALKDAGVHLDDIDLIAVTQGPGLKGSLLIGICCAKTISYIKGIPIIGINHLEGHIYANFLVHKGLKPPLVALVISGGHTELILMKKYNKYEILGRTRDDAIGEAYDKVSKFLGLGYPGGPIIDNLAKKGDSDAIEFPRPYLRGNWDFSFSGIKTAVVNYVNKLSSVNYKIKIDIVSSFQKSVIEVLVNKTIQAAKTFKIKIIIIGGGVASNSALRKLFDEKANQEKIKVYYPTPVLCTDNAAMIACAAYYKVKNNKEFLKPSNMTKFKKLTPAPDLEII